MTINERIKVQLLSLSLSLPRAMRCGTGGRDGRRAKRTSIVTPPRLRWLKRLRQKGGRTRKLPPRELWPDRRCPAR